MSFGIFLNWPKAHANNMGLQFSGGGRATISATVLRTVDETIPGLPMAPDDRVSVVLADGKVIEHPPVAYAKGSWERPLDREELLEKFLDCATRRLECNHAQALFDQLWDIAELPSVRKLLLIEFRQHA